MIVVAPRDRADPARAAQALDRGGAAGRDGRAARPGRGRAGERRQRGLGARDDPRARAARPTSSSRRSATARAGRTRMGCEHVLVDRRRRTVPISGTRIRRDPHRRTSHFLSGGARAHYVKRVCMLGAESTGKTTLARASPSSYGTVWNPEYGHVYSWFREPGRERLATRGRRPSSSRSPDSRTGTRTSSPTQANRVLFCDTDAWTTGLFHEIYLGERSAEVDALADREYDLYDRVRPGDAVRAGRARDAHRRAAPRADARGVPRASAGKTGRRSSSSPARTPSV